MIKTTDLMLGNWVEYATGLHKDKRSIPMQVTGIFSDTVYLNFEGNEGDVFEEEEENLLGIPLTGNVLLLNGFEKENDEIYTLKRNGKIYFKIFFHEDVISLVIYDTKTYTAFIHLRYLHQLQNAYFMLTGKQLEVRL